MVNLRCGCKVSEEGKFILGENCKNSGCKECEIMPEIHPFGNGRLKVLYD